MRKGRRLVKLDETTFPAPQTSRRQNQGAKRREEPPQTSSLLVCSVRKTEPCSHGQPVSPTATGSREPGCSCVPLSLVGSASRTGRCLEPRWVGALFFLLQVSVGSRSRQQSSRMLPPARGRLRNMRMLGPRHKPTRTGSICERSSPRDSETPH